MFKFFIETLHEEAVLRTHEFGLDILGIVL